MRYVFIANDPGGYDSIISVAEAMKNNKDTIVIIMLTGKAAQINTIYQSTASKIYKYLNDLIYDKEEFILVTGTSWESNVETSAIRICNNAGKTTISILDYWCNYIERFAYQDSYVFPKYLFVMDQLAYDESVREGIPPQIIKIVGTPGLDRYISLGSKKKVLFLSQPLSLLNSLQNDGFDELLAFKDVIKACNALEVDLKIKFHPKESDMMRQLYDEMSVNGELEELVDDFDVIIGMSTMGLLKCVLLGVPIISYEPNLFGIDKNITNKLGITKCATTYSELLKQLRILLGGVEKRNLPFWFDGKSTQRCVDLLLDMG